MSEADIIASHLTVAEAFLFKPETYNCVIGKSLITKIIRVHPQGNMNACTRCYGYPLES